MRRTLLHALAVGAAMFAAGWTGFAASWALLSVFEPDSPDALVSSQVIWIIQGWIAPLVAAGCGFLLGFLCAGQIIATVVLVIAAIVILALPILTSGLGSELWPQMVSGVLGPIGCGIVLARSILARPQS